MQDLPMLARAERALEPMRTTLAADGYELKASVAPELLVLAVEATADACEECLIPRSLFQMMAESALSTAGLDLQGRTLLVRYPPGHPDEAAPRV